MEAGPSSDDSPVGGMDEKVAAVEASEMADESGMSGPGEGALDAEMVGGEEGQYAEQGAEGEGDYEGGDEDEDEDEDTDGEIDPNHPQLQRVQARLLEQYQTRKRDLDGQIREKTGVVARLKKKREQIGVELYEFQQKLARRQLELEKQQDEFGQTAQERVVAEKRSKHMGTVTKETEAEQKQLERKRLQERENLDQIKVTLKQIEDYNRELKGEIQVTRRAAYGTEEGIKGAEREKKQQDYLIDETNEQIKSILERTRLFEGQIESQAAQTRTARESLREAEAEIKKIESQKREYTQRWKTSVIGMRRRDEALEVQNRAVLKADEERQGITVHTVGVKKSIIEQQQLNEQLTAEDVKLKAEVKFLMAQKDGINTQVSEIATKYEMLQQSVAQSEEEIKKARFARKSLQSDLTSIRKVYEKFYRERTAIDNKIEEELKGEIDTLKRGKQSNAKAVLVLRQQIAAKEIEIGEAQNELARLRVDILNNESFNKTLSESFGEIERDLKEKDEIINKYETEFKKRASAIERSQLIMARLNKKYDDMVASQGDEEVLGPLEGTIKTLRRDIEKSKVQTQALQRSWIASQGKLVEITSSSQRVSHVVKGLRARMSVLATKALRLQNETAQERVEVKGLERQIRQLHLDSEKINGLIAESTKLQTDIATENRDKRNRFAGELREAESKSRERSIQIASKKEEKEVLFQQVVEAERQILLLEKKIQIERETAAALDPEFGQPEVKAMKKEIHRMEMRLSQLKRQQEKMITVMERTILKNEVITKSHEASKSKGDSRITVRKKIAGLKSAIRDNIREFKRVEMAIREQEGQNKAIFSDVESLRHNYSQVEDQKISVDLELQLARLQKRLNSGRLALAEKRARRCQELLRKKALAPAYADQASMGGIREREMQKKIREALVLLQENQPKYATTFDRLNQFLVA